MRRRTPRRYALGDAGAALERVVDALDRVLGHGEEEAARELRARGARVEERGRRVREEALRHELVRLERGLDVGQVDADRDAHDHVLRALDDLAVEPAEVALLERLEAEVLVVEVAVVDDRRVDALLVLLHDRVKVLGHERRRRLGLRVDVVVHQLDVVREELVRVLVQVRDRDPRREPREIGVLRRHVRGCEPAERGRSVGVGASMRAPRAQTRGGGSESVRNTQVRPNPRGALVPRAARRTPARPSRDARLGSPREQPSWQQGRRGTSFERRLDMRTIAHRSAPLARRAPTCPRPGTRPGSPSA